MYWLFLHKRKTQTIGLCTDCSAQTQNTNNRSTYWLFLHKRQTQTIGLCTACSCINAKHKVSVLTVLHKRKTQTISLCTDCSCINAKHKRSVYVLTALAYTQDTNKQSTYWPVWYNSGIKSETIYADYIWEENRVSRRWLFHRLASSIADIRHGDRASWGGNHLQRTLCRKRLDFFPGTAYPYFKVSGAVELESWYFTASFGDGFLTGTAVEGFSFEKCTTHGFRKA